jgi:PAS domain S-box-containing protein
MTALELRVLLIEDNPADARLIDVMLAESAALAVRCEWVDNLTDGIARLRAGRFDVVLLDLGLPESSGLETLQRLRHDSNVPTLVVLSGLTDEAVALQALELGAQDYLVKGLVDGPLLTRAIRYAIGRTVAEEALRARTAELRQQAKYLRTLIDTLPMYAWLKDTHGRYLAVNQATAHERGSTPERMAGRCDADFWPAPAAAAYRADDLAVMSARERRTVEHTLEGEHGTTWIETYKAPVLDEDGTVLGTVGIARDISERKAVEAARDAALAEAEQLARQRSAFLAQMSHELRTPLNGILGFAQILQQDKGLTERQARGLKIIRESGQHLLTLINDILEMARIDAAKVELNPGTFDLRSFLAVVTDIVRVKAEEKPLLFVQELSGDLPCSIRADEKRLRQVLLNLLSNAVKFTDEGRVVLGVSAGARTRDTVKLRFEVHDSGIGMSRSQMARLFKPFEQVGDTRRREGGTGLGLAISRELVRLMGSDIEVWSAPGKGSKFSFELELPVDEAVPAGLAARGRPAGYAGPRRRILIVDDVPQNRSVLVDSLEVLGFELFEAADGREALASAERLRPDLVVMDVTMPVLDGLQATRRLRQSPALRSTPVIASSGGIGPTLEAECRAAGADAFIAKPVEQAALLDAVARLLALRWIHEEDAARAPSAADG